MLTLNLHRDGILLAVLATSSAFMEGGDLEFSVKKIFHKNDHYSSNLKQNLTAGQHQS